MVRSGTIFPVLVTLTCPALFSHKITTTDTAEENLYRLQGERIRYILPGEFLLVVTAGLIEKFQALCWQLFAPLFTSGTSCLFCCFQLVCCLARKIIPQIPLFSFQFPSHATSFIVFAFSLWKPGWRGSSRKSKCFSLLSSCTLKTAQLPIQILCITH